MTELFLPYASPLVDPKTGYASDAMKAWMRGITPQASAGGGSVMSVGGTAPIASSGGATPVISLNDDGVTFAKMQDIDTQTAIGRDTAGNGDPEQVTITQMLDWTP